MASKNVETLSAAYRAFNRRDFDAAVSGVAENFTYEDRTHGVTFKGRSGFKEFIQSWVTAMSNVEISEPQYIDGGNTVVAEFTGRGTNDGPLGPLPKTGKQVSLRFCEVMRFNDQGQIVSGTSYYDQLSLMIQLGHAQSIKSAAAG